MNPVLSLRSFVLFCAIFVYYASIVVIDDFDSLPLLTLPEKLQCLPSRLLEHRLVQ